MKQNSNTTMTALAALFQTETPDLMRYACYRLGDIEDAKDIVQNTFLKLHSRLSEKGISDIGNLRNYLFRMLANLCTTQLLQQKKMKTIPLKSNLDMEEPKPDNFEDDYHRISILLGMIPEAQAEVIRLRIYGDNSFAEIAEILSLPISTVKSQFLYGMDKIRRGMQSTNR